MDCVLVYQHLHVVIVGSFSVDPMECAGPNPARKKLMIMGTLKSAKSESVCEFAHK